MEYLSFAVGFVENITQQELGLQLGLASEQNTLGSIVHHVLNDWADLNKFFHDAFEVKDLIGSGKGSDIKKIRTNWFKMGVDCNANPQECSEMDAVDVVEALPEPEIQKHKKEEAAFELM